MKKTTVVLGALCLIMFAFSGKLASDQDLTVSVKVSPNTIALNSRVHAVTVHAGIPYSIVDPGSVTLEGIPATFTFPDARGNLVAKFDMRDVREIVEPPEATFELCGLFREADGSLGSFSGTDTVRVKD